MFSFLQPRHIRWNIDRFTRIRETNELLNISNAKEQLAFERRRRKEYPAVRFRIERLRLNFARKFVFHTISRSRVDIPSLVEISRIKIGENIREIYMCFNFR